MTSIIQTLAATTFLTEAIRSSTFFANVELANDDASLAFGEVRLGKSAVSWKGLRVNAHLIRLDFKHDRRLSGDPEVVEIFSNTVFPHEVAHMVGDFVRDPSLPGVTGPGCVDTVNRMTDVLGRPRRIAYVSSPVGCEWFRLAFSKPAVNGKGETKEKRVYIQWLKRDVGGRGID